MSQTADANLAFHLKQKAFSALNNSAGPVFFLFSFFFCNDVRRLTLCTSVGREGTVEVQLLNLEDLFIIAVIIARMHSSHADISWRESCRRIDGCCIPFGGEAAEGVYWLHIAGALNRTEPSPLFCCFALFPAVTSQNAPLLDLIIVGLIRKVTEECLHKEFSL